MCQSRLTSVDYAKFILLQAYNHGHQIKNMMQLQNILFYIYGVYYVNNNRSTLFEEIPQIWAFGTVFPQVYEHVSYDKVESIPEEQRALFTRQGDNIVRVMKITQAMSEIEDSVLDEQCHNDSSFWGKFLLEHLNENGVVNKEIWGSKIDLDSIYSFFNETQNQRYGTGD